MTLADDNCRQLTRFKIDASVNFFQKFSGFFEILKIVKKHQKRHGRQKTSCLTRQVN